MVKDSTRHDYKRWAARRSTEALAALVAEHAGRCAQARLSGLPYRSGSAVLDRKLSAAAAELDRRCTSEALAEAARLRNLGGPVQQIRRGMCQGKTSGATQ